MITDYIYAYSLKGEVLYVGRTHNVERRAREHKNSLNPNNSKHRYNQ